MNETTESPEFTCQELVELITDYLEHHLSEVDNSRFEEHLATCSGCTTYLDHMRQTVGLVGHLDETSLSDDAQSELLKAFADWKSGR